MSHPVRFLSTVPRSVSTSFERMMMACGDHTVLDEPFSRVYYYGPERRSDRYDEQLSDSTVDEVLDQIWKAAEERPVFVKDVAHHALGVPFLAEALTWPSGMRDEWDLWDEWHASTASSTGFEPLDPPPGPPGPDGPRVLEAYRAALPVYERFAARSLGADPQQPEP